MLGHVDGQGKILSFRKLDNSIEVAITLDKALMRYIVEKGSVAIDGISLSYPSYGREDDIDGQKTRGSGQYRM